MILNKTGTTYLKIKNTRHNRKVLKKHKITINRYEENGNYHYEYINSFKEIKQLSKRISIILLLTLGIFAMIFGGLQLAYFTRDAIPIDIAADNVGYICEDVTDLLSLGDKNATGYLIGKDADTINENFIQYIEFSTNTYAGAYYQQEKSTMKDMAKLSQREFTDEEIKKGNTYRYTIKFDDNEIYELIVNGKKFIYSINNSEKFYENFEKILVQTKIIN